MQSQLEQEQNAHNERVKTAAEAFIRAEWEFRCGLIAYHGNTQEWYEDAADALREAVTGNKDLAKAGETLGKSKANPPPRKRLQVELFPGKPSAPLARKRLKLNRFFSNEE